jgi:hypothetical protein
MHANDEIQQRQIQQDKPFAWQSKAGMKTIADVFDNDIASARSVYVALTEIASDEGSETFTRPIRQIADRAGIAYRTAATILNRLESLKLIAVERGVVEGTNGRASSTFTMLGNKNLRLGNGAARCLPRDSDKKRKKEKKNQDDGTALGNSTPFAPANGSAKSVPSFFEGYQNQNQPVQNHVKWPEYAAWCRRKGGQPTEKGFWTWWGKQKPQWRNKVRQNFDGEGGYELDGKFYPADEANRMAEKNSELALKFRKATKIGDKIHIDDPPSGFTQKSA